MRVHIGIVDSTGRVVRGALFEGPVVRIGSDAGAHLQIPGFDGLAVEIHIEPEALVVRSVQGTYELREATVFRLDDQIAIRLTPVVDPATNTCPRCAAPMREHAIGGAYRSMARAEQTCTVCGTSVIELDEAARTIGAFTDLSRHDWLTVVVQIACNRCRTVMVRSVFRTDVGQAEVERCTHCSLVIVDPDDRRRLAGP